MPPEEVPVVVVGAGLAGLRAALVLSSSSVPFVLLEASDGVGGRVRTDEKEGFLLDRGFQIFLSGEKHGKPQRMRMNVKNSMCTSLQSVVPWLPRPLLPPSSPLGRRRMTDDGQPCTSGDKAIDCLKIIGKQKLSASKATLSSKIQTQ